MFNKEFYEELATQFARVHKSFNKRGFVADVTCGFEELSLNQRMRNTSVILHEYLPANYDRAIAIMKEVIPHTRRTYTNLLFPDFVGLYGKQDFDGSMDALKYFTKFGSSEFAVREFLKLDFNSAIKIMYRWAEDKDHHVRRLASEGSRPRLPWSFKLDEVIKNPEITQPILEKLKQDNELYVRKSVANHLNDISKENSEYMLKLLNSWDRTHPHTAWIVKHASRTLIKKGHPGSLSVFGFTKNVKVAVQNLKLHKTKIKLGEKLTFRFDVLSLGKGDQKLVIDYLIHYRKKDGGRLPKVFKLKELDLKEREQISISKTQLFKDFTTRKHYKGKHLLELQVNGKKLAALEFVLI